MATETWSHGSIVKVYMKDFMQYGEATFEPGPCLNVILGPNGSGKSTIVNAICLGVGGKAKFLDRAKDPREFIREGAESSELKIELFNDSGSNWTITRKWSTRDSRTHWLLNGASVLQKNIEALTKELRIQVENLCQFLPQDRVQGFSKMDAKTLLDSTIEAVGEDALKQKHERLKLLQKEYEEFEDQYRSKQELLAQSKSQMERMDGDVKNYHEKQKVDEKIGKKFVRWMKKKKTIEASIKKQENTEIKPVRNSINKIKSSIETVDNEIRKKLENIRSHVNESKNYSNKIENLQVEYSNCDLVLEEFLSRVSERESKIESIQKEINNLKSMANDEQEEEFKREFHEANQELISIAQEESNLEINIKSVDRERDRLDREISLKQEEIKRLNDVGSLKITKLQSSFADGKEAVSGLRWLKSMSLRGKFYDPIILTINVYDPSHAFYFENSINIRDLVAFGAEETEDVSEILRFLRKEKNLKVNVIHMSPNVNMNSFQPRIPPESFPPEYNFKGYLSDLFDAPLPVKAYLLKQYQFHNTAVFGSVKPSIINKIVHELKISAFFVERERYNTIVSAYTSECSSTSFTAHPRNWIQMSVDSSRIKVLEDARRQLEDDKLRILDSTRQDHQSLKEKRKMKEETTERVSKLNQKISYIKQHRNKLRMKEKNLAALMDNSEESSEEERVQRESRSQKTNIIRRLIELNKSLFHGIQKHGNAKIALDLEKMKSQPLSDQLKSEQIKLQELENSIECLRTEIDAKKAEAKKCMNEANEYLLELEKLTGNRRISEELKGLWEEHDVPNDVDKIEEDIDGLETESACIGNIDRSVVEEYLRLKETVTYLEDNISTKETETNNRREDIESLKSEWIGRLTTLVDNLDSKFRSNFDYMGYAGQIQLKVPDERNNFNDDYGIEIYVKYRENVRLAKLTPHLQSGGERSVATALYMMSLQELTIVPFRCVDEINQGMDATNERKVFDILINTSSREDRSAQYFLLTPKLLPDLSYNEMVKIHVVYNGTHMLQYPGMSAGKFLQKALLQRA
ncbi:LOW QUALITY PROTEIN: structural maintenance of chromosomes protein 5 [Lepeophtheirus salmonis]|uniref:LOW QUALITY PROTEIN: structural maintenance of chromosomes protein 5 n=1 Tax=Lepeophtheirus salmonis TaxID=72036 RepID=UPI003AF3B378